MKFTGFKLYLLLFFLLFITVLVFAKDKALTLNLSQSDQIRLEQHKTEAVQASQLRTRSLTDAQKKLGTELLNLSSPVSLPGAITLEAQVKQLESAKEFVLSTQQPDLKSNVLVSEVYVYVYFMPNSDLHVLENYGRVTDYDVKNDYAVIWTTVNELENIAALPEVRTMRRVMPPMVRVGASLTEGDAIHNTDEIRSNLYYTGSGIKVGIISDGVDARATAQTSLDLPADGSGLTVLSNAEGGEEGTAMLEIVHDMVPDAGLFFHDMGANTAAFNSAIDDLVTAGCDVICDDIGWLLDPFFEDGSIAAHVNSVCSTNDIIYVSSAGNAGQKHHQSAFYAQTGDARYHDFSGGTSASYPDMYCNIPDGSSIIIVLQWDDEFGSSGNDYVLDLYSETKGEVVATSDFVQNGNDDPLEVFPYTADATTAGIFDILVYKKDAGQTSKTIEVFCYPSGSTGMYSNNISPIDAVFGHAAADSALAVGAIGEYDENNDDIELFSSQGPSTIVYPSPASRNKPDICGIDGVDVSGAGGFSDPFFGTSAAAPHVAAIAAQLWCAHPDSDAQAIKAMLLNNAVDLGDAGFDNVFGNGRADALRSSVVSQVALSIWLEGAYDAGSNNMRTDLKGGDYVPTTSPYGADPRTISAIPGTIVDWVLVQLRETTTGATIASRSALLRNDGKVVGDDGVQEYIYVEAPPASYRVIVQHRNHLGVMTATNQSLSKTTSTEYDFTTGTGKYEGSEAADIETTPGEAFGMFAGETNNTGTVTVADKSAIVTDLDNSGYYIADTNLSGTVTVADKASVVDNLNVSTSIPAQE